MTDLVLFTHQFPYGFESEPFLESEVPILAEHFDRVVIIPSTVRDQTRRPIPANAEVETASQHWLNEPPVLERILELFSPHAWRALRWSVGTPRDLLAYFMAPRVYLNALGRAVVKYRELKGLVEVRGLQDAVFYDYWFANSTLPLALLRGQGTIRTAVSRAHRYDVFDEAWDSGPVPFRQAKAVGLDAVFPTSHAAELYLRRRVPALRDKMEVHRLGVRDPGAAVPPPQPGAAPVILTCASLHPVKRLHLVPEALSRLGVPFRWVHIGEGPQRDQVEAAAQRLLPDGSFEFLGQLRNTRVREYYRTHSVQCLLSVSSSEGLPVSMMEAVSYGVPIVACDVGGVSELVNDRTGMLMPKTIRPEDIAATIRTALSRSFDPLDVRAAWREHYDAASNYKRFAETLLRLRVQSRLREFG